MKVIVHIPCLNEAATLPATIADIPRRIEGVTSVEVLVIDETRAWGVRPGIPFFSGEQ